MLLDQKRTKRIVQVIAVLTSIAFVGIGVLVIGVIFFGSSGTGSGTVVKDARAAVDAQPRDADLWGRLAAAYDSDNKPDEAVAAAARAVKLEPDDFTLVQQLVSYQSRAGQTNAVVATLQTYTRRNPDDPDGFLLLGRFAADAGKTVLARLAYQRFLALDPDNQAAPGIRDALNQLGVPAVPASP